MIIAYLIFSASRKSEQNQVWAGMAKAAHQIGTPLSSLMALELLKEKIKMKKLLKWRKILNLKLLLIDFQKLDLSQN